MIELKNQQQVFNADFKFIDINHHMNSNITNNWIKAKDAMEKKDFQDVFKCWAYNFKFDYTD